MGPILTGLFKLQSVETRLRAAKAKLARCRRNVIVQENQIRTLTNNLESKKEEIMLTKVQADRLELELKSRDDAVNHLRAALNTSKTNKEYAAVLTQLNTTRADNSKIESQILDLMKDIEIDEQECKKIEEQIEDQKKILEHTRAEAENLGTKYQAEIDQIQAEWESASKEIPADALEVFKRVAETYDGEALAIIEEQEGKTSAYSCGGCFMGLTHETVNLLMTKDDIIRCPICSRILVLAPAGPL
ncbi:MAG: C4-type zinc ribbon domain-containing protein [Phycisphaerae bacterium]